jgi:nucleotide-binding universal stress UspA family protein
MHKILIATDFSTHSDAALAAALELAHAAHASVTLLHVCQLPISGADAYAPAPEVIEDIVNDARQRLARTRERVAAGGISADVHTRIGDAADEIVRFAGEQGCDFIVVGTHGRRGFRRLVLGSVAERVTRAADVPVLTVRAPAAVETAATG